MKIPVGPVFLLLALFSTSAFTSVKPIAMPSHRLALVIGNNDYVGDLPRLANAVNDANAVADLLERQLCFDKVLRATNANRREMLGAFREFETALNQGDIALVYYSGNAAQIDDREMLLPVDFPAGIVSAPEAAHHGVDLTDLITGLSGRSLMASILLIDSNTQHRMPSSTRRLERIVPAAPTGWLILHATQPGAVALDGVAHSPVAAALLQYLGQVDLGILDLFNAVTLRVHDLTAGQQTPYLQFHLFPQISLKGTNCAAEGKTARPSDEPTPAK